MNVWLNLNKLINPNCSTVILGDFNLPNVNWNTLSHIPFTNPRVVTVSTSNLITLSQLLSQNQLFLPLCFRTHPEVSNLLDQILCNDPCAIFNVQVDSPFRTLVIIHSITFNLLLPMWTPN